MFSQNVIQLHTRTLLRSLCNQDRWRKRGKAIPCVTQTHQPHTQLSARRHYSKVLLYFVPAPFLVEILCRGIVTAVVSMTMLTTLLSLSPAQTTALSAKRVLNWHLKATHLSGTLPVPPYRLLLKSLSQGTSSSLTRRLGTPGVILGDSPKYRT